MTDEEVKIEAKTKVNRLFNRFGYWIGCTILFGIFCVASFAFGIAWKALNWFYDLGYSLFNY